MPKILTKNRHSGQTLVLVLVVMIMAITITTAAIMIMITNSTDTGQEASGQYVLDIAESGAENALLRLLRDPNFAGETIGINGGTSISTVSGTTTKTIDADGKLSGHVRKIEVVVSYNNNVLNINSWKEVSP